jgi:hypothetical protein
MKKFMLLLPIAAIVLLLVGSAFAGKPEASTTNTQLYWYEVTYDSQNPNGIIQSQSDFVGQDTRANVSSYCDPGNTIDCLRGFSAPLMSFPANAQGIDQVKKP